jgi:general secretion pathway protein I
MADTTPNTSEAGLTLLEVIVALAILALGLAALFDSIGLGTDTALIAGQQRAAASAAQSLLAELGRTRPIVDGRSDGIFATGQRWQLDLEPLATSPGPLQGHSAALTVSWDDDGRTRALVFDTLVLAAAP